MRFTANRKDLLDAVTKASQVIPSRAFIPILESVLCEVKDNALTVTGTDSQVFCIASCNITDAETGALAIPAKRLITTLRQLTAETVTIFNEPLPALLPEHKQGDGTDKVQVVSRSHYNNTPTKDQRLYAPPTHSTKLILQTETGEYSMTGESASQYPVVQLINRRESLEIDADVCKILSRALGYVSVDTLRPAMMGVLIENDYPDFTITTTDGHRLYSTNLIGKAYRPWSYLLPPKALQLALKNKATVAHFGPTGQFSDDETDRPIHCSFFCRDLEIQTPLIDEQYPSYQSVIPRHAESVGSAVFRRSEMLHRAKCVLVNANARTKQITLTFARNEVSIKAEDSEFGGSALERMHCTFLRHDESEDAFEIGVNGQYLLDVLSRLDTEYATFHLSSPTRAILIKTDLEGERLLLMPVRLTGEEEVKGLHPAIERTDQVKIAIRDAALVEVDNANILPQCPGCNAAVEPTAIECPNCQAELEPTAEHCVDCSKLFPIDELFGVPDFEDGGVCEECASKRCVDCELRIDGPPHKDSNGDNQCHECYAKEHEGELELEAA